MNNVTLLGRLGKDPESKTYGEGKTLVKFSLATDDGFGDNKKTNWHNCTAFGKQAEVIEKYVHKGDRLAVIGRIEYREHDGRHYTDIIVTDFDLLGHRPTANTDNKNDGLPF